MGRMRHQKCVLNHSAPSACHSDLTLDNFYVAAPRNQESRTGMPAAPPPQRIPGLHPSPCQDESRPRQLLSNPQHRDRQEVRGILPWSSCNDRTHHHRPAEPRPTRPASACPGRSPSASSTWPTSRSPTSPQQWQVHRRCSHQDYSRVRAPLVISKQHRYLNVDIDGTTDGWYRHNNQTPPHKVHEATKYIKPIVDSFTQALKPILKFRTAYQDTQQATTNAAHQLQKLQEEAAKHKQKLQEAGIDVTPTRKRASLQQPWKTTSPCRTTTRKKFPPPARRRSRSTPNPNAGQHQDQGGKLQGQPDQAPHTAIQCLFNALQQNVNIKPRHHEVMDNQHQEDHPRGHAPGLRPALREDAERPQRGQPKEANTPGDGHKMGTTLLVEGIRGRIGKNATTGHQRHHVLRFVKHSGHPES